MSNYLVETEYTTPKKCCKCNKEIYEGLTKIDRQKEVHFCLKHGIQHIRTEINLLEFRAMEMAKLFEMRGV